MSAPQLPHSNCSPGQTENQISDLKVKWSWWKWRILEQAEVCMYMSGHTGEGKSFKEGKDKK